MRCRICNTKLEFPTINAKTGEIEICGDCMSSVKDTLDDFREEEREAFLDVGEDAPALPLRYFQ